MAKNTHNEHEASEVLSRGEHFFEKNANLIFYIALGVIIVAFGIWAYLKYVQAPRADKAYEAIYSAEENFINRQDSAILVASGLSNESLLDVAKKYKGTKASNLSHVYAGIAYYDMGQYEKALDELKKYKGKDKMVAPSVVRLMGDCSVQLNKLDEAINYFVKAASRADNDVVSPGCLIKAARVYEQQNKVDKALALYREVKDKYYTSPEATQVLADITRLEGAK